MIRADTLALILSSVALAAIYGWAWYTITAT